MSAQQRSVGELLRRYRLAAGLSQAELAERAGLSRRGISDIERGDIQAPHRDTLARLADALELASAERSAFQTAARRGSIQQVVAPSRPPEDARVDAPALVGRQRELALIERHLAGETAPLLIFAGEPGIGKSRLLDEAATRATDEGWRVITSGCTRQSGQAPYEPFVSAFAREVRRTPPARLRLELQGCGWLVRLLPELLETQIVPAPAWTLAPEQERRLMFGAVARYLANVAGSAGTLLLLDDLQWAGGDALALLETLVLEASESDRMAPLRLLGAYRATEVHSKDQLGLVMADLARAGRIVRHSLGPLSHEESALLLAHLWPVDEDADPGVREATVRHAEGHPFYLVSIALTLRDGVVLDEASAEARVPASVTESVQARVAALPEAARRLVGVAAVTGRVVPGALLLALTTHPEEETLEALEALVHAGLLAEDGAGNYRFTHDLVREAVEATLGSQRRRTLHRRLAEEMERGDEQARHDHAAEIATHFLAAGERQRALPYALAAGDQAEAIYAHAEAESHYRMALDLAHELGDASHEAKAREKVGMVFTLQGRQQDALAALERAASLCLDNGDGEGHLRVSAQLAGLYGQMWRADEGLERFAPLAAEADESGLYSASPGLARFYNALAGMYAQKAVRLNGLHAVIRAEQLARAAHDDAMLARVLTQRGRQGFIVGDDEGAPDLRDVLALAERVGDPQVYFEILGSLAGLRHDSGDLASAQAYMQRYLTLAEQVHDFAERASGLISLGQVDLCRGDWRQARTLFEQAEAIHQRLVRSSVPETFVYIPMGLATLNVWQGHGERAVAQLAKALTLIQLRGVRPSEGPAISALSECDLLEGRVAPAYQRLSEFCARPAVQGWVHLWLHGLPLLAWAQLELGDVAASAHTSQTAVARARARSYPIMLVDALRIHAMVNAHQKRYVEATGDLNEALSLCQTLPYPYAEAKALRVYGQVEAARGDPVAATERFMAALAICDRLGEGLYRPFIVRDLAALRSLEPIKD
jgi:transcriptional regulator with XRE-family HTH domain/tetratricopeptide (TPR) repeat protein